MMRFRLSEIAALSGGRLVGDDVEICGMIHDSRQVQTNNLFVALPGERSNGHRFIQAARSAGATAALVSESVATDLPRVRVDDVLKAMGRIAAAWRARLDVTVVGVTGSNGKTTVKEMLAAIFSGQAPTLATGGNYNNEIGLPLTMSRLNAEHRFAVLEMGASRPGDIRYLAEMARPDAGVVTNAAPAHLEGFGSLEGVARTKGELFQALPENGVAAINADDRFAPLWRDLAAHCRSLGFGLGRDADVRAGLVNGSAHLRTPWGDATLSLKLPGRHNLLNALAALAISGQLGISLKDGIAALAGLESLPGRLQIHQPAGGWRLIDDTYNANPGSLKAGLEVLAGLEGEAWLVLGDMAELGPDSEKLHAEMGRSAAELGIERLLTVGEISRASASAFGPGADHFESHQALQDALEKGLHPGVNCLIKGSRSMGMERIVQALIGENV
jgi:UDP-N-acetylmuramoyl-tripeptide--D-alanyl-D-alanine ligase